MNPESVIIESVLETDGHILKTSLWY